MRLDSSSEGGEATELTLNSTQESWIWAGYMWEQNHGDTMFVRQSSMAAVHLATRISRNECRKFGKEMRRCRTSTSSAAASSSSIRGIRTKTQHDTCTIVELTLLATGLHKKRE
ncbi:hypothetical protein Y032_0031g2269 [Ancylostoma ceylanicum]|nr:hypothetical protein Y032_0031g2269 [Ancylostoma ceylanicum]